MDHSKERHPKVFISHAGEDRDRFVKKFATILRGKGIDAWASFGEINDGDSLIRKIFLEGIDKSSHFIVILSKYSITKPWVTKELDIAVVKQISEKFTIIPVLIDDIDVPIQIKEIKYRRIKSLDAIEDDALEIINSILGIYEKPPLGELPPFTNEISFSSSLARIDNVTLNICFDLLADTPYDNSVIDFQEVTKRAKEKGFQEADIYDSLVLLYREHYLDGIIAHGGEQDILLNIKFTSWGFNQIASKRIDNYDKIVRDIAAFIYNTMSNNEYAQLNTIEIADKLNLSRHYTRHYTRHIVQLLHDKRFIKISEANSCSLVTKINPELKRWLTD